MSRENLKVYVISADENIVKVGISIAPDERLSSLKTASHCKLSLCYSSPAMQTAKTVERVAHKLMSDRRLQGEWFSVSPEEAEKIVIKAIEIDTSGGSRAFLRPEKKAKPQPKPMTGAQLTSWRKRLGYREADAARLLKTPVATYRSWEDGRYRIPGVTKVAVSMIEFFGTLNADQEEFMDKMPED